MSGPNPPAGNIGNENSFFAFRQDREKVCERERERERERTRERERGKNPVDGSMDIRAVNTTFVDI